MVLDIETQRLTRVNVIVSSSIHIIELCIRREKSVKTYLDINAFHPVTVVLHRCSIF